MQERDDPTLDYLYLRKRQQELQKSKQGPALDGMGTASRAHILKAIPNAAVKAAKAIPLGLNSFIGNIGEAITRPIQSGMYGGANPSADFFDRSAKASSEAMGQMAADQKPGSTVGTMVGGMVGGGLPYMAAGAALPLRAAAAMSGGLTALQASAGRDASTIGMVADMTDDEGWTGVVERIANNPAGRVAADVGIDLAFSGLGAGVQALRAARRAPTSTVAGVAEEAFTPRSTPETNPNRQLPPGRTEQTAPLMGNQPRRPADQPLTTPPVQPRDPHQRVVEPTPEEVPLSGSPRRRSAAKQAALMEDARRTAAILEKQVRGNRAVPIENSDASAALAGASGFSRQAEQLKRSPILDQFGNRAGRARLEALNTLTGMGVGAGLGGAQGDDTASRKRNAMLGGLAGAGLGFGATRALDMALDGIARTSTELPVRPARPTPDVEFDDIMQRPMGPQPMDPLMDPANSASAISMRARRGALGWWGGERLPNPDKPRLLGVHSMQGEVLSKALIHDEGLPAPSIAIVPEDAPTPHFGDVSLLFKEHITDPQAVGDVFMHDAYTPRAPSRLEAWDAINRGQLSAEEVERLVSKTNASNSKLDPEFDAQLALKAMMLDHPGDWRGRERGLMTGAKDPGNIDYFLKNTYSLANSPGPKTWRTFMTPPINSKEVLRGALATHTPRLNNTADAYDMVQRLPRQYQAMKDMLKVAQGEVTDLLGKVTGAPEVFRRRQLREIDESIANAIDMTQWELREFGGDAFSPAGQLVARDKLHGYLDMFMENADNPNSSVTSAWKTSPEFAEAVKAYASQVFKSLTTGTQYAEAKPKRMVGWNEVAGIMMPEWWNSAPDYQSVVNAARSRDIPVVPKVEKPPSPSTPLGVDAVNDVLARRRVANELKARGRNPYGFANPGVLSTMAGGSGGALLGGSVGDTPEERQRNAAIGAAVGAGAGAGIGGMMGKAGKTPGRKSTAYMQGIADGTLGTPKPRPNMVPSLLDRALPTEGVSSPRVRITDAQMDELAKALDTDAIVTERVRMMDPSELTAVAKRITDLRVEAETLADEMGRATPETVDAVGDKLDAVMNELLQYDEAFNKAASSYGRGLRQVAKVATAKGTLEAAVGVARRVLGVKQLAPAIVDQLRGVMRNPKFKTGAEREKAMTEVLRQAQKLPWWEVALDARRVGLLTSPVTWMVNTTGNVLEASNQNFIVAPTAAAFDAAWSAMTGAKRTVGLGGRGAGLASGAKRGGQTVNKRFGQVMAGQRPDVSDFTEQGFESLARNQVDYVRDVGQYIGEGPARTAQGVSDVVFTAMDAADQPFYQAALDASYAERAHLRAVNAGLKRGTREYTDTVEHLLKRDPVTGKRPNMEKVDEIVAIWEALDATFKSQTGVIRRAETPLGRVAQSWFVPFIKTPTNLIRKAFEAIPGLGFAVSETHLLGLKEQFKKAGIPEAQVADELRRARTLSGAKQLTTGAGLILAGYALAEAGMLSGDYVPAMGRDEEDTMDARRRATMNTPPLSITIDGTSHSLAAAAQFAPFLAFGYAIHQATRDEVKSGQNVLSAMAGNKSEIAGRTALAAGRTVAEFPMLQGLKNAADLFAGEKAGDFGTYAGREAATLVPGSAMVATVGRLMDPVAKRKPEGFTQAIMDRLPGLREQLPAKVGPMGEVTPRMDPLSTLFSPTRPQRANTGPLYEALDKTGFYPTNAPQGKDESYAAYAQRRQQEGPNERRLLESVLGGGEGWSYVSPAAADSLAATGDWKFPLQSALSRQRTLVTQERRLRRPSP